MVNSGHFVELFYLSDMVNLGRQVTRYNAMYQVTRYILCPSLHITLSLKGRLGAKTELVNSGHQIWASLAPLPFVATLPFEALQIHVLPFDFGDFDLVLLIEWS